MGCLLKKGKESEETRCGDVRPPAAIMLQVPFVSPGFLGSWVPGFLGSWFPGFLGSCVPGNG
eukprot:4362018-Karenia_brevis.AAC.1